MVCFALLRFQLLLCLCSGLLLINNTSDASVMACTDGMLRAMHRLCSTVHIRCYGLAITVISSALVGIEPGSRAASRRFLMAVQTEGFVASLLDAVELICVEVVQEGYMYAVQILTLPLAALDVAVDFRG